MVAANLNCTKEGTWLDCIHPHSLHRNKHPISIAERTVGARPCTNPCLNPPPTAESKVTAQSLYTRMAAATVNCRRQGLSYSLCTYPWWQPLSMVESKVGASPCPCSSKKGQSQWQEPTARAVTTAVQRKVRVKWPEPTARAVTTAVQRKVRVCGQRQLLGQLQLQFKERSELSGQRQLLGQLQLQFKERSELVARANCQGSYNCSSKKGQS